MTLQDWVHRWSVKGQALQELLAALAAPTAVVPQASNPGTEAAVQQALRLRAPHLGAILWRNNVGALQDKRGVEVRYGLCNESKRVNSQVKSSDLVGVAPGGRFLAVEVKAPGWAYSGTEREEAQLNYLNIVWSRGGVGMFATGAEDLEKGLGK